MNELTVLQASQGLASYVSRTVTNALSRGVVIGHDHRHQSKRFAELTALAFKHLNFNVHLYAGLVHTPLVPFGVDELGASCGVMITASHNPAQDNGYKVYWGNGCQIIPPLDTEIAAEIEQNLTPWTWNTATVAADEQLTQQISKKYFEKVKKLLVDETVSESIKDGFQGKFVYTAMHGVGEAPFQQAAELLGLSKNIISTEEQQNPDPDFPTVKFPNPEEKGALDIAKSRADEYGSSLVLANDPDADRFAVAAKDKTSGKWVQLTGNQLGALFANHTLKQYESSKDVTSRPLALLNSTVSSQLIRSMAKKDGFYYEDTLTGFKWIGNRAQELVSQGYTVPFAFEEAIGYMFSVVFDKDGISAATVFLQMAVTWHNEGTSALEVLETIYKRYGYFAEYNSYYVANEPQLIVDIFTKIRQGGAAESIGPYKVVAWRDLTIGYDSTTPDHKPVLPVSGSSQMITAELEVGTAERVRFTARGSGTEPKLKIYIEAVAAEEKRAQDLAKSIWDLLAETWFSQLRA